MGCFLLASHSRKVEATRHPGSVWSAPQTETRIPARVGGCPSPRFLLSHTFPPSLSQEMSPVWNSSHPPSSIQVRLLSFGLKILNDHTARGVQDDFTQG